MGCLMFSNGVDMYSKSVAKFFPSVDDLNIELGVLII
jgi:hypothetical protein